MRILRGILPFFIVLVMNILTVHAQDEINLDSIRTLLQTLEGEEHLRLLIDVSNNPNLEKNTRLRYAEDAVDYAMDIDRVELITESCINLGNVHFIEREDEEAIRAYQDAYNAGEVENYRDGMANALVRLGRAYYNLSDQTRAVDYLEQARAIANDARNLKVEAESIYLLGNLHRSLLNDLEAALGYYQEALPIAREAEDQEREAQILADIGLTKYLQGNFIGAIESYEPAIPLYRNAGDKFGEARMYTLIANANIKLARRDSALINYQEALPIFEEINSRSGIMAVLNGMAVIYVETRDYDQALEMHLKNLEMSREMGDENDIANSLNNIAIVYSSMASDTLTALFGANYQDSIKMEPSDKYLAYFSDAIDYYNQSLEVREKINDRPGIASTLYNIGLTYLNSGKPGMAFEYLERALEMNQEMDRAMLADLYAAVGQVYLTNGNYTESSRYLQQSLDIAKELDIKNTLSSVYLNLSDLYSKLRNFEQSLAYFKLHSAVKDALNQKERMDQISEMQVKYETEAVETENALLVTQSELNDTKLRQTRIILTITIVAIGIFLVMVVQLIRQNNLKKKANRELERSNTLITEQKKEITDSIQYASRIQTAMLPPGDYVDNLLPERFIIYMPRDIVSGDYYYITEKDDKIICVAADCTGHGVPGAFMSMLGIAFLNEIISKQDEVHTDEMLGDLRAHVIKSLHQTGKEGESQDGMDLAMYIADMKKMKIEFSGANNSLLMYRNGEMIEAKADKMPIGIHTRANEPFTRHNLDLKKGDMIYTFTDGYPDQFGGPKQKKFMIKKLKDLLREINKKSVAEQKRIMEQTLGDWMADADQVDDILVIGVRV